MPVVVGAFGFSVGIALALVLFGRRGQHWALRVLCVIGAGAALVGLVIAILVGGGGGNLWADFFAAAVVGWVLTAAGNVLAFVVNGAKWAMTSKERTGAALAGAAAAVVGVLFFTGGGQKQGTGPRGGKYCIDDAGTKRYR